MRVVITFSVAAFLGLIISACVVHSTAATFVSPDFLLVLTVALSLHYHNPYGAIGAFFLGLLGDFASAQFVGPNAAGCVVAFSLVGIIANRVYADKTLAVMIITFLCSLAKSFTYLSVLNFYLTDYVLPDNFLRSAIVEGLISAAVAPLILRALRGFAFSLPVTKPQAAPAFQYPR